MTLYDMWMQMEREEEEWILENSTDDYNEYEDYVEYELRHRNLLNRVVYAFFENPVEINNKTRYLFNFNHIAIFGKVFVVNSGLTFINPTNLDLLAAAELAVYNTGDYHFTILESYRVEDFNPDVKYCELDFGS